MATILLVEDDLDVARSFVDLLHPLRAEIHVAEDGARALETLSALPLVDVIILDLFMPRMNGWEFLEARKLDERIAHIPVLVVSAWADLPDGPLPFPELCGVLHKPVAQHQLVEAVRNILEQQCPPS